MRVYWGNVPIPLKYAIYIVAGMILGAFLTTLFVNVPTPFTPGTKSDWISFFGNMSGGLIGGFVAYRIAKVQTDEQAMQFHSQRIVADIKDFISQLPALISMKVELEKVRQGVNAAEDCKNKVEQANGSTYYGLDDYVKAQLLAAETFFTPKLKPSNWAGVWNIRDSDLLVELLIIRDFYEDFSELAERNLRNDRITIEQRSLYQSLEHKKLAIWNKYLAENFPGKIEIAIGRIESTIQDVHKYRSSPH